MPIIKKTLREFLPINHRKTALIINEGFYFQSFVFHHKYPYKVFSWNVTSNSILNNLANAGTINFTQPGTFGGDVYLNGQGHSYNGVAGIRINI